MTVLIKRDIVNCAPGEEVSRAAVEKAIEEDVVTAASTSMAYDCGSGGISSIRTIIEL